MVRKIVFAGIISLFVFLASGCTIGGAAAGCAQGAAQGFKEDVVFIKKADSWIKENLW